MGRGGTGAWRGRWLRIVATPVLRRVAHRRRNRLALRCGSAEAKRRVTEKRVHPVLGDRGIGGALVSSDDRFPECLRFGGEDGFGKPGSKQVGLEVIRPARGAVYANTGALEEESLP